MPLPFFFVLIAPFAPSGTNLEMGKLIDHPGAHPRFQRLFMLQLLSSSWNRVIMEDETSVFKEQQCLNCTFDTSRTADLQQSTQSCVHSLAAFQFTQRPANAEKNWNWRAIAATFVADGLALSIIGSRVLTSTIKRSIPRSSTRSLYPRKLASLALTHQPLFQQADGIWK